MGHALRSLLWFVLVPLPLVYALPFWMGWREARQLPPWEPLPILGLAIAALGTAGLAWCFAAFVRGRGTPAPYAPPKELVSTSFFRFSRNPIYVCVVTVVAGEALWWSHWGILVFAGVLFGVFHLWILVYEEPGLRERFGKRYEHYCARVPRWLGRSRSRS
jgi:protein-S-isoprenylcysteine O-methyltransferase Ste14